MWELAFAGSTVYVKHSKGMEYIAHLLRSPDQLVLSAQLFMAVTGEQGTLVVGSAGEVLDPAAFKQYRSRVEDLENQLDEAERNHDQGRKEAAETELDQLHEQVFSAAGLGGRNRNAHDDAEKIRKGVGIAIERAIASIQKYHPALADYLKLRIKRGRFLMFQGDGIDWQF
jgi:non-specific serine/threonine protein kinase